jgi:hypothetical protein
MRNLGSEPSFAEWSLTGAKSFRLPQKGGARNASLETSSRECTAVPKLRSNGFGTRNSPKKRVAFRP